MVSTHHLLELGIGHVVLGLQLGRLDGQGLLHLLDLPDSLRDLVQANVEVKLLLFL